MDHAEELQRPRPDRRQADVGAERHAAPEALSGQHNVAVEVGRGSAEPQRARKTHRVARSLAQRERPLDVIPSTGRVADDQPGASAGQQSLGLPHLVASRPRALDGELEQRQRDPPVALVGREPGLAEQGVGPLGVVVRHEIAQSRQPLSSLREVAADRPEAGQPVRCPQSGAGLRLGEVVEGGP